MIKLSWLRSLKKYLAAKNPKIISMITMGIFFNLRTERRIGVSHAIDATISKG
jgi:hypothetical protein